MHEPISAVSQLVRKKDWGALYNTIPSKNKPFKYVKIGATMHCDPICNNINYLLTDMILSKIAAPPKHGTLSQTIYLICIVT